MYLLIEWKLELIVLQLPTSELRYRMIFRLFFSFVKYLDIDLRASYMVDKCFTTKICHGTLFVKRRTNKNKTKKTFTYILSCPWKLKLERLSQLQTGNGSQHDMSFKEYDLFLPRLGGGTFRIISARIWQETFVRPQILLQLNGLLTQSLSVLKTLKSWRDGHEDAREKKQSCGPDKCSGQTLQTSELSDKQVKWQQLPWAVARVINEMLASGSTIFFLNT